MPEDRLAKHNQSYYPGQHFTSRTSVWELYLVIPCRSSKQAAEIEKQIKRMKSKVYIQNLKRYPEMVEKLLNIHAGK